MILKKITIKELRKLRIDKSKTPRESKKSNSLTTLNVLMVQKNLSNRFYQLIINRPILMCGIKKITIKELRKLRTDKSKTPSESKKAIP